MTQTPYTWSEPSPQESKYKGRGVPQSERPKFWRNDDMQDNWLYATITVKKTGHKQGSRVAWVLSDRGGRENDGEFFNVPGGKQLAFQVGETYEIAYEQNEKGFKHIQLVDDVPIADWGVQTGAQAVQKARERPRDEGQRRTAQPQNRAHGHEKPVDTIPTVRQQFMKEAYKAERAAGNKAPAEGLLIQLGQDWDKANKYLDDKRRLDDELNDDISDIPFDVP